MSVEQFRQAQGRVGEAAYQTHRNYAYAAGYFESLAYEMFRSMTKQQQAAFLRQVEQDALRLEALAQIAA
jgi:hypothetical protein